jgi:hypothetical protein
VRSLLTRLPRPILVAILLLPTLLLIDTLCYQVTLPVTIDIQHGTGLLTVGSTRISLGKRAEPQTLQFVVYDPLVHEYQIDGSDSTNNRDLDTGYLSQLATSPYYRLQSWMRNLDGTSRWRDLTISSSGRVLQSTTWPGNGAQFTLPATADISIHLQLARPETPRSLNLVLRDGSGLHITLDRNNRQVAVSDLDTSLPIASAFFPLDSAPFAAMIIDTLARILLWAIVLLLAVQCGEMGLGLFLSYYASWRQKRTRSPAISSRIKNASARRTDAGSLPPASLDVETELASVSAPTVVHSSLSDASVSVPTVSIPTISHSPTDASISVSPISMPSVSLLSLSAPSISACLTRMSDNIRASFARLFQALHPLALLALACSLIYVLWIAVKEYQGQPHIYDASAYLFAAKMYASGQLSLPAPPVSQLFPGPFMVIFNGRWFSQYDPGTSLTLVPGIELGVPWLIEPLLGTLALLGIGLIASRLYNRRVATLAVLLGCLSPFYSYLAASYLSHAVALFYLVWGLWALLRFIQGEAGRNLLLCGLCFGMAALTRDLVALLYIALLLPGVVLISWKRGLYRQQFLRRLAWWLALIVIGTIFLTLFLGLNFLLTGSPDTTPRSLFFAGDTWGFGRGIGFYGQHTLAAGLVNLDELLTGLQIDLFGWPFSLTLAFLALPFLIGKAKKTDCFLLLALIVTVGSYIGYFYHGIYLGPRYLFEDLPFLLILTARGILALGAWSLEMRQQLMCWLQGRGRRVPAERYRSSFSLVTLVLVSTLVLCNLLYFLPRQAARYQNYTGLPNTYKLNIGQIYQPPVHHAIVVTDDLVVYQNVLFPLNDPQLKGDVVYAWGYESIQYAQLRKAFPGRTLYLLVINFDGSVSYIPLI